MNGQRDDFEEQFCPTDDEDAIGETQPEETTAAVVSKGYRCVVCAGTGWMEYPHPDDEGGFMAVVGPCPACVGDRLCPACGEGMIDWGVLRLCVLCGFTFDEADAPEPATVGRL